MQNMSDSWLSSSSYNSDVCSAAPCTTLQPFGNLFSNAHFSLATCGYQGFTNWFLGLCAWGLSGLVLAHVFDTPDIFIVLPTLERETTCHVHTKPAECEVYMIPFMCFLGSYPSTCTRRNYPDYFLLFSSLFFFFPSRIKIADTAVLNSRFPCHYSPKSCHVINLFLGLLCEILNFNHYEVLNLQFCFLHWGLTKHAFF